MIKYPCVHELHFEYRGLTWKLLTLKCIFKDRGSRTNKPFTFLSGFLQQSFWQQNQESICGI